MMRFRELNEPTTEPETQDSPEKSNQPAPIQQPSAPAYASKQDGDVLKDFLLKVPNIKQAKSTSAKDTKLVPHVRISGISPAELKQAMTKFGAVAKTADNKQVTSSSSFPTYSFEKDGKLYSVVISMKRGKKADDENFAGISRKELTPVGLQMGGQILNKSKLITATKNSVDKLIKPRDPVLASALVALVDSAASGGNTPLPEEYTTHIQAILPIISQDFGEILAPLMIMDENDRVEFPSGANPLIDVKLPKMNLSVKALTGSGTSFRSISQLMDKYEDSIKEDPESQKKFSILKSFHPKAGGKNVDKIIAAGAAANIPEYAAAVKAFGNFKSWPELEKQMNSFPWKEGSKEQYADFLQKAVEVFTAAGTGSYVGMPADGKFYLKIQGAKEKKEKAAGYPSFRANPFKTAADVITYSIGAGLLNYIRKGPDAEKYSQMMTDIVNKADAVLGHITINSDGTLELKTRPFNELKFEFQYHAPSHIPGNNLPGFMAVN